MELTPEQQTDIVNQWIRNKLRRNENKSNYAKPTAEQRADWNKTYYNKNKEKRSQKQKEVYDENKEKIREKAKYYYYKKNNKLDILKERYPEIAVKYLSPA